MKKDFTDLLGKLSSPEALDLFRKLSSPEAENALSKELEKVLSQAPTAKDELIEELVQNYQRLLRLLKIKSPSAVSLDPDDLTAITVDGKTYDLDLCFTHNDRRAAEYRASIDALFADLAALSGELSSDIAEIEARLNG